MKRELAIASLIVISGCGFSPVSQPPDLQPLPTTGLQASPVALDSRSRSQREEDFVANVRSGYVGALPMTDIEMIYSGEFWCSLYGSGMSRNEINDFAESTAVSSQDLAFTRTVIANAFLDLC